MKKKILSVLLCLCMAVGLLPTTALAASTNISTFAELQTAFSNGGDYTLTQNITVTAQLTLASDKTLTIHGNGYTIQPAVTGLNEQGIVNTGASAIDNIIENSGILTLENLTIYGGEGRCISNSGTLTMNGVSLERAHLSDGEYGAGLYNFWSGKALLTNCNIRRNGCEYSGGGFYNFNGTLILESCAIVENRNLGNSNGGGAGENHGEGAKLYMNNCTVANNQSPEIGGGLNNYYGTAYIMNSTFTGNVTIADAAEFGGGIGNNRGTVYAVNSAFAFNYANGVASDIGIFNSSSKNVNLYNCAYGTIQKYSDSANLSGIASTCIKLTTANTPESVSALFNGTRTSGIVDQNGNEQSTTYARPVITQSDGTYGVYPAESSALKSGAVKTYYECDSTNFTVKMSYGDGEPPTRLGNLDTTSIAVTRPGGGYTSGLIGAMPANFAITRMYTVKVNPAEGGTVTGGSAQGNSYPAGTTISITAVPGAGYVFSGWKIGTSEAISSTANPYSIANLTGDVTLTPVFNVTAYSISLKADGIALTSHAFPTVAYSIDPDTTLTVTVTNTGSNPTGDLTATLTGGNTDAFVVSGSPISSIAVSGTNTFTVQPKTGLAADTYSATVTVSGGNSISAVFTVSFTVSKALPSYAVPTGLTAKYGQTLADVSLSSHTGWSWVDSTQSVGTPSVTPKSFNAKFTPADLNNYHVAADTILVTVNKADAPTLSNIAVNQKYTVPSGEKDIGTAGMPADAGTLTYTKGSESKTGSVTVSSWDVDSTGKVTYTLSGGAAGDTVTLPVVIKSDNYADTTVNVVITLTTKDAQATLTVTGGTTVTYGQTLTLSSTGGSGTGAVTYEIVAGGTGDATIAGNVLTPTTAGTVNVKAVKAADNDYSQAESVPVAITINKATPTGAPAYTPITTSGKTLGDAALNVGGITPGGGTIAWDMGNAQTVAANTAYSWTFTPSDTANYNNLTGSITPYVVSYSGGDYTPPTYKVESEVTEDADGSVSFSKGSASKNDTVTITVTPDRHYKVEGVTVKDKNGKEIAVTDNGDGTFTFKMPASKVTVEPVFSWDNPFTDVSEEAYYTPAVEWALKNDITNGAGDDTTFGPDAECTRAQIVTFLWRAAGCPEPAGISSFTDVSADAYYAKAVAWAVEQGITNGTGDGTTFSPDATCTRSQGVTFLYRSAGSPVVSDDIAFNDVTTGSYYSDAVVWATQNGVTDGTGNGKFSPVRDCTRAQIVTFLYRWMVK